MLSIAAVGTPYLQSISIARLRAGLSLPWRLLGGLLLFVFFCSSRAGSWLDIESECSTCCVCAMAKIPRESAGRGGERRSAVVACGWKLRNAAEERLRLAKPLPKLVQAALQGPRILHSPAHGLRKPSFDSGSDHRATEHMSSTSHHQLLLLRVLI
jgi:hypothetical protein